MNLEAGFGEAYKWYGVMGFTDQHRIVQDLWEIVQSLGRHFLKDMMILKQHGY